MLGARLNDVGLGVVQAARGQLRHEVGHAVARLPVRHQQLVDSQAQRRLLRRRQAARVRHLHVCAQVHSAISGRGCAWLNMTSRSNQHPLLGDAVAHCRLRPPKHGIAWVSRPRCVSSPRTAVVGGTSGAAPSTLIAESPTCVTLWRTAVVGGDHGAALARGGAAAACGRARRIAGRGVVFVAAHVSVAAAALVLVAACACRARCALLRLVGRALPRPPRPAVDERFQNGHQAEHTEGPGRLLCLIYLSQRNFLPRSPVHVLSVLQGQLCTQRAPATGTVRMAAQALPCAPQLFSDEAAGSTSQHKRCRCCCCCGCRSSCVRIYGVS